jgi:hypothetical protein
LGWQAAGGLTIDPARTSASCVAARSRDPEYGIGPRGRIRRIGMALGSSLLVLAGCTSLGPATIRRDRCDFAEAIVDASKREALLNIVKLRYADTPSLVSVNQLVARYSINGTLTVGTDFLDRSFNFANDVNLGASGSFTENPTVTYAPIAGEDFARVMLTPIPPSELFAMLAAGAPPDVIGLAVQSINGLRNWSTTAPGATPADAAFIEVLDLLMTLRRDALIGFAFETQAGVLYADLLINAPPNAALAQPARRLIDLLGLDPAKRSFRILFGFGAGVRDEVKVYTRSLFEILDSLAARIEVPDGDVTAGRTYPSGPSLPPTIPALAVRHQYLSPGSAFAAVEYRGTWFWVADDDYASKRVFTGLMLLLNIAQKTGQPQLPVITIPTG